MSDADASTIASEGDLVVNADPDELSDVWNHELDDGDVATFDADCFPDNIEASTRVYFEHEGFLYAASTIKEVGQESVWGTGVLRLHAVAESPVEVPDDGFARIQEDAVLPAADQNVSTDTVVDVEEWR